MAEETGKSQKETLTMSIYNGIFNLLGKLTDNFSTNIDYYLTNGAPGKPPTLFKSLLKFSEEKDFFMTLNYDLVLDWEIISTFGFIDYGINEIFTRKNYPYKSKNHHYSVYHLHGCLGWEREIASKFLTIKMNPVSPTHRIDGCNLMLIPPGKKDFPPVIKNIWRTTEGRLANAKELIIIGCSLNPKDERLIELIKQFIAENNKDQVKVIYHKLPSDDKIEKPTPEEKNYIELLGSGFNKYDKGFDLQAINFIYK